MDSGSVHHRRFTIFRKRAFENLLAGPAFVANSLVEPKFSYCPRCRHQLRNAIASGPRCPRPSGLAGDKNVLAHGAGTAQLALAAGVLDELEIHLIPVLLGQGRRLFDTLRPEHIELERTWILEGEAGVTHMRELGTGAGREWRAVLFREGGA